MISKKLKVLVSVLVAVVLLSVGGAAVVMARGEEPLPAPGPGTKALMVTANTTGILARVAVILGVTEEELADAFKQAQQEMKAEAATRWLDKAVEEGRLTEEEADAIKEWWQQKPEVLGSGSFQSAFGAPAMRGRQMMGGYKSMAPWSRHMMGSPGGWGWSGHPELTD